MITEVILVIFAILYYLFSAFLNATIVQDTSKHSVCYIVKCLIFILLASPIVTPIILGIVIGEYIRKN